MTDLQSAVASFDALKKEFNSGNTPTANQKCRDLLQKLKVLMKLHFLAQVIIHRFN
jgi:hypothetical protein